MKITAFGRPAPRCMGVIVPSSNQVVERVTEDVLGLIAEVDASYMRVPYYGRNQGQSTSGYDYESLFYAVELLVQAGAEVIVWNATRATAFDFDIDRELKSKVEEKFDARLVTTSLATLELVERFRIRRLALVHGGTDDYRTRVADCFRREGLDIVAELDTGALANAEYARIDPRQIVDFIASDCVAAKPDCVLIWSTNLPGHGLVAGAEEATELLVLDSAAIGVWAGLKAMGIDPSPAAIRGRLFAAG